MIFYIFEIICYDRSSLYLSLSLLLSFTLLLLPSFQPSQLAWAPGRGVKGAIFKDYWELASGASYIPWDKIPNEKELEKLSDGGWIVPETCPPGMKPPEIKREQSLTFQYPVYYIISKVL